MRNYENFISKYQTLVDGGYEPDLASSIMSNWNNTFDYDELEKLFSALTLLKDVKNATKESNKDVGILMDIIKDLDKIIQWHLN